MHLQIGFSRQSCSLVVCNSIEVRFLMALVQWCSGFVFSNPAKNRCENQGRKNFKAILQKRVRLLEERLKHFRSKVAKYLFDSWVIFPEPGAGREVQHTTYLVSESPSVAHDSCRARPGRSSSRNVLLV